MLGFCLLRRLIGGRFFLLVTAKYGKITLQNRQRIPLWLETKLNGIQTFYVSHGMPAWIELWPSSKTKGMASLLGNVSSENRLAFQDNFPAKQQQEVPRQSSGTSARIRLFEPKFFWFQRACCHDDNCSYKHYWNRLWRIRTYSDWKQLYHYYLNQRVNIVTSFHHRMLRVSFYGIRRSRFWRLPAMPWLIRRRPQLVLPVYWFVENLSIPGNIKRRFAERWDRALWRSLRLL